MTKVYLTDGTVYDHLELEAAWNRHRTILISDGMGQSSDDPEPDTGWAQQASRIVNLLDYQQRGFRRRQILEAFRDGRRRGAYWSIHSQNDDYDPKDPIHALELAEIPTRLRALPSDTQEQLINCGYVMCDASVRKHLSGPDAPESLPYPRIV